MVPVSWYYTVSLFFSQRAEQFELNMMFAKRLIRPTVGAAARHQAYARPVSSLSKILQRELKHDLDAGGDQMPEGLVDLQKIVLETMNVEVQTIWLLSQQQISLSRDKL